MVQVSQRTALITGASDGIGLELAKLFAKDRYTLIIVSDNRKKLEDAEAILKGIHPHIPAVHIIEADLAQVDGAKKVYAEVQHLGLKVDVLVNNAGVGVYGNFAETDLAEELSMIFLNACAVVQLSKFFVNDMLRQGGGRILITSSVAGLSGAPFLTVYGATKAFDFNFAMGLREELKDKGISVTALLPSETDTNFFHRAHMEKSKIYQKGDMANPADVAKAGYEALMRGDSHVAAPTKAKIIDFVSHVMPETTKASIAMKQQEPVA